MAEITLEEAPRKVRDVFEKGLAAMERNNLKYAMDMFQTALEVEPRLLQARKFLRAAEVKQFKAKKGGAMTHAISNIQGVLTLLQAQSHLKKKPLLAVKLAEKLMRIDPLNMTFVNLLADAAVAADLPEAAIMTLDMAKENYPKNVDLLKKLGKLLIDNNQPHEARACYETIVELRPNDPKALKSLKDAAALDTMKKGWDNAKSYRDVMKDSKEAVLLEQQAKAVKTSDDIDSLIDENRRKVEQEPNNINYRRALADLLTRAERFDEALEVLRGAQEASGHADPQVERAISAVQLRRFDHQIAELGKAGQTQEAEKKEAEKRAFMIQDAADKVRRYPNDLQFRYEYGVLLFENDRLDEAIEEFQLAQRNPQRRIRTLYYMALCFKGKKQYDIALEQLEKANSELSIMDNTKKDILYQMALLNEAIGKIDQAAAHLKEIYSVDIRYKDVAERIEKVYKK